MDLDFEIIKTVCETCDMEIWTTKGRAPLRFCGLCTIPKRSRLINEIISTSKDLLLDLSSKKIQEKLQTALDDLEFLSATKEIS